MNDFLLLGFIFLIAGVISVPLASRFGLGSVLGYLLAGIAISPILAAIGVDVIAVQHFAEFGVVMMLFLVGLELEPQKLISMRTRLLGLGGLQVGLTTLLIMALALVLGQGWTISLAIGLILALSSTAIVLQTLQEKGLLKSDGGQASFSVLLFQDIAVIPMLALLPLLALPELATMASGEDGHGLNLNLAEGLAGWQQAGVTLLAIGFVILFGNRLTRPLFRFIAMAQLREVFVAAALLIVIGIALLMIVVGLSPALGVFLAGVVLANSEYRHELESNIEPFKGLLLGLFFITVGASIDFELLNNNLVTTLALTFAVIAIKIVVLFALSFLFNVEGADRWLMTFGLAQAGEFGFVLLSFAVASSVLPQGIADQLLLVVALSMLVTPILFIVYDKLIAPRYSQTQEVENEAIETGNVIIAGHGRMGGIINRILRGAGYNTVVLDYSSEQLEMLRTFGIKVFFGDATRPDLLHAAGIEEADMLVVALDDREQITALVQYVRHNWPHLHVVARATNREHVYELWGAGCRDVIRETFDSSVRMGRSALEALGVHPFEAERLTRRFVTEDKRAIRNLANLFRADVPLHENAEYVAATKVVIDQMEDDLNGTDRAYSHRAERGWTPPDPNDVDEEGGRVEG